MVELLSQIASTAGFLLGIIYGLGLVIVTLHLNRYGITNLFLIQVKYIVVGVVFCLHVFGMLLFSAPLVMLLVVWLGPNSAAYVTGPLGAFGLVFLLLASFSPLGFERKFNTLLKTEAGHKAYWRVWYLTQLLGFLLFWQFAVIAFITQEVYLRSLAFSLLGVILFVALIYYTIFLYQAPLTVGNPILELIGAGRPIPIKITMAVEKRKSVEAYQLFRPGKNISRPLRLLDETNQELIVLVENEGSVRAVKISKALVQSVIYLP